MFDRVTRTIINSLALGILLAAIALTLSACGGASGLRGPESPGQMALAVEVGVTKVNNAVERLARAEKASRQACADGVPDKCKAPGSFMTRDRGIDILDYASGVKTASRIAVDAVYEGRSCVEGQELEVLGIKGCVDGMTVLRLALAGINEINTRLSGVP